MCRFNWDVITARAFGWEETGPFLLPRWQGRFLAFLQFGESSTREPLHARHGPWRPGFSPSIYLSATEDHMGDQGLGQELPAEGGTALPAPQGLLAASRMGWEGPLLSAPGPALATPGFAPEGNYLAVSWCFVGWSSKTLQEPAI